MSVQNNPQAERQSFTDVDSAADAILSKWEETPEMEQSENEEEATEAEVNETDQGELFDTEEETESEEVIDDDEDPDTEEVEYEEEDEEEVEVSIDDTLVDIQVGDETHQASVSDLKRLYGQEASLTRKSQDLAQQRKEAEVSIEKTHAVLQRMLEQAEERYSPYKDVDMLVAAKEMDTEDFAQLRKDAQAAESDLKFLREEADQFYGELKAKQHEALQAQAQEAVKVLREEIPDWSNDLYNDIRSYAVSEGLPQEAVDQFVDPTVIKILNKARLYEQGKKVATVKKTKTQASKKVLKTRTAPATKADRRAKNIQDARKTMRQSKDLDDVASALMSRWEE